MFVQGVLTATLPLRVAVALILAGCHTCPFSTIVAHHVWSTFSSAHHEMLAIGFQIVSSVGLLGAFTGSRSSVALYVNHNQSKLVTRICLVFRFLVMKERRATHATADRGR